MRPYMHHVHDDILAGAVGFIKAQILLVSLTAFSTMAGLLIFGFRYAVLMGVLAGLLDFVPYLGPTTLLVPWSVFFIADGKIVAGIEILTVMLAVAVVRQLAEPRFVGQKMGLHPLVAIGAMYFGAHFFGPAGFVVGPISAMIIKVLAEVLDPPPGDLPL
jgi:predicted PurR-regulated permease PerM